MKPYNKFYSQKAHEHALKMKENYPKRIEDSISKTKIYSPESEFLDKPYKTKDTSMSIRIVDIDTVGGIMEYPSFIVPTVLNFASYKNPGGLYLAGAMAQEECLCHESDLFNVLVDFNNTYYEWNKNHKNKALYENRALFSPNIFFSRDTDFRIANVITCAAPNYKAARKYCHVTREENKEALKSRIQFVLDIAVKERSEYLILGAFGCGVFSQNAEEVASIFREFLIEKYMNCFKEVVFAIPKGNDSKNYDAFVKIFEKENANG